MDSLHKKSQKPNIIAPRPTRIKFNCRRINSKNVQFVHHQIFQWTKKTPTMPWRTQGTAHAIRDLIDQNTIAPSSLGEKFNFSWAKWLLHKLPSQDLIHGVFLSFFCLSLLPKYQPKRGGDLGWGKLFRFKCGIKNYLQIANVDSTNVWS